MRRSSDLLVLCYHAVSPDWPAALSVTPEAFEAQIAWLRRAGYKGTTFTDAALRPPGGRTVAITFDDAYRSVGELAFPILEAAGMPASIFVPTAHIDAGTPLAWKGTDQWLESPYAGELAPLSWDELGRLAESGWELGSHTCTHPFLTQTSDEELANELEASREACERAVGRPCESIAYPYGDVDDRVVAAAAQAGYAAGAGLPRYQHAATPLEHPRVGVYHVDDLRRFRIKTSPIVRRLRSKPIAAARPLRQG